MIVPPGGYSPSTWVSEVLSSISHRPWPLSYRPWVMVQSWHDLLFAHWPLPASILRESIPAPLEVDLFEGSAWIGIVPFEIRDFRFRRVPPIPGLSAFPELNLRTYVRHGGRSGVWFLSLDATNRLAIEGARTWYRLPYFRAEMAISRDGERVRFSSTRCDCRSRGDVSFEAEYRPKLGEVTTDGLSLDRWLTERYCLFAADKRGALYSAEIHHQPWPLQPAEGEFSKNSLLAPLNIELPQVRPVLHFSKRLDVLIWSPVRVRK